MNEITKCLNHLCEFIRKKRVIVVNGQSSDVSYMDLTGNEFGAFKGNSKHKEIYTAICTIMETSNTFLNKKVKLDNITTLLFELFIKCQQNELNEDSFMILNDLINKIKIGGHSIVDDEPRNKLIDLKNQLLNLFNQEDTETLDPLESVIPETQVNVNENNILANALNRLVANSHNI
jgi:hypothetical protein